MKCGNDIPRLKQRSGVHLGPNGSIYLFGGVFFTIIKILKGSEQFLRGLKGLFLENLFLHKLDRRRRWRRETDVNRLRITSRICFALSKNIKKSFFGPIIRKIIPKIRKIIPKNRDPIFWRKKKPLRERAKPDRARNPHFWVPLGPYRDPFRPLRSQKGPKRVKS